MPSNPIEFSGLRDCIDRPFKTYSSGMQARLTFAMARHAAVDLSLVFKAPPRQDDDDRASARHLESLQQALRNAEPSRVEYASKRRASLRKPPLKTPNRESERPRRLLRRRGRMHIQKNLEIA